MVRCLVQLSDLHIKAPGLLAYGRVDTAAALKRAVESVNRLSQAPDAVVVTGDLTDFRSRRTSTGTCATCSLLCAPRSMCSRAITMIALPFARRSRITRTFRACGVRPIDCVQYAVDLGGLRLVTADTVVPDEPHGALDRPALPTSTDCSPRRRGRGRSWHCTIPPFARCSARWTRSD